MLWIVLAAAAFGAGLWYLFHCMRKLDCFLQQQETDTQEKKQRLCIAFSDPAAANHMVGLLEGFSEAYPELELSLVTSQNVLEAVYDGKAEVGFLPAEQQEHPGLHSLPLSMETAPVTLPGAGIALIPLETASRQEMVWKRGVYASPADSFARYLRDRISCGNVV